ncbi:MAG: MotA/TolQ/ExbB proton channel family protein [Verrucomicrobiota bacterium]
MIEFLRDNFPLYEAINAGGAIMIVLFILSYILYHNVISLLIYVSNVKLSDLEARDRSGLENLARTRADDETQVEWEILMAKYEDVISQFRHFVRNRLRFTGALLVAAPLLGLLGTVLGMLDMFHGLTMRAGHETTLTVVDGVKKSLVTTQTGLTVAIPAIFIIYWIRRASRRRELELLDKKILVTDPANTSENA